jgi:ferric-dicitrate binding protein FerR (iron transport regulator)
MSDQPFEPDDPRSIARALAHELTESEAAEFQRWLADDPGRRWELEQLRRAWIGAGRIRHEWDAESALLALRERASSDALEIRPRSAARLPHVYATPRRPLYRSLIWAAAACVAAIAIGTTTLRHRASEPQPAAVLAMREVRTDLGETAELRFPDGTEVRLAPRSSLRYPADMLGPSRDLELDGEAYIVAGEMGRAPLVVHTALGTTRDIGTRFVVRARPEEALDVVVLDGLVVVRPTAARDSAPAPLDSALVRPGMLGRITAQGRVVKPSRVNVDTYVAWLDGRLEFADAPLGEVFATLGRWRSVHYTIDDPRVAGRRFTGSFDYRDRLDEIASLIAISAKVRVERHGDSLVVHDAMRRAAPGAAH